MLGVFIPVVQATTGTANEVRSRVVVDVFLKNGSTKQQIEDTRGALLTSPERQEGRVHLQGPGARQGAQAQQGGLRAARHEPAAGLVPRDARRIRARWARSSTGWPRADQGGQRKPALASVDEVRNREEETDKILNATSLVKGVTAGLAILLVLCSVALVANTIRLSIYARRREVEVMKLVGATNWFIRWPFMIEGVIVGLFAGVLAILLLTIAKETVVDPLADRFALLAAPDTIDFPVLAVTSAGFLRAGLGPRIRV